MTQQQSKQINSNGSSILLESQNQSKPAFLKSNTSQNYVIQNTLPQEIVQYAQNLYLNQEQDNYFQQLQQFNFVQSEGQSSLCIESAKPYKIYFPHNSLENLKVNKRFVLRNVQRKNNYLKSVKVFKQNSFDRSQNLTELSSYSRFKKSQFITQPAPQSPKRKRSQKQQLQQQQIDKSQLCSILTTNQYCSSFIKDQQLISKFKTDTEDRKLNEYDCNQITVRDILDKYKMKNQKQDLGQINVSLND
ncbi:hypothetical protein ABPG72_015306 [Tetrahymena utriculariae]